jgi:hypothetical protein
MNKTARESVLCMSLYSIKSKVLSHGVVFNQTMDTSHMAWYLAKLYFKDLRLKISGTDKLIGRDFF